MAILQDMTVSERAELEALRAENARLKQKGNSIKVTEKGGVSVYGLGRFPVTLYHNQWYKLFDKMDDIKAVLEAGVKAGTVKVEREVD